MTDHKFTDEEEEVINCLCFYVDRQCNNCDIKDSACCVSCVNTEIRDALALINRQKAEIERLTAERDNEHRCYLHICEDLKQAVNRNITAKSEAIKDFAQRLKEKRGTTFPFVSTVFTADIDTLVKEMTEGNNE